ncbi:MAG: ketose-bisphosphate aldolase, partial [Candidatus Nealsonbacteria bacterium CG23_combo_of_CG06-09_8_20_14_all_39_25]
KKAIKSGIVKININTELRMAYTNTLKKSFQEKPTEIVSYKYMPLVVEAVQKIVEEKIRLFGSQNKA